MGGGDGGGVELFLKDRCERMPPSQLGKKLEFDSFMERISFKVFCRPC